RETIFSARTGPLVVPPTPLLNTVSNGAVTTPRLVHFPVLSGLHAPPVQVELVAEVERVEFAPVLPRALDLPQDDTPVEPPLSDAPVIPQQGSWNQFDSNTMDVVCASRSFLDLSPLREDTLLLGSGLFSQPGVGEESLGCLPVQAEDSALQVGLVVA